VRTGRPRSQQQVAVSNETRNLPSGTLSASQKLKPQL
jgi:hypothetical protein